MIPNWNRAYPPSVLDGRIKQEPQDFQVDEELGFEPAGEGAHELLRVEKTGANTTWIARALARHAGVPARDVGYSGMKDRQAVTRQWFSVPHSPKKPIDWRSFDLVEARICERARHNRKLKRGCHAVNRFRILIRCTGRDEAAVDDRLSLIACSGVPNYFGVQRFGHSGRNLELAAAVFSGTRVKRDQHGIALSAARSLLFNEVLSARVGDGTWDKAIAGDVMNLDGSGSVFSIDTVDEEIRRRCEQLDIHPTGPLWGRGQLSTTENVAALETGIVARHSDFAAGLERFGLDMSRRALRLTVSALNWQWREEGVELQFSLGRGSYATSVLREVVQIGRS